MRDPTFWELTLSGIVVSWPGVAVGVWLSYRGLKKHVDRRTDRQTNDIETLTAEQTEAIEHLTADQTSELMGRKMLRRRKA